MSAEAMQAVMDAEMSAESAVFRLWGQVLLWFLLLSVQLQTSFGGSNPWQVEGPIPGPKETQFPEALIKFSLPDCFGWVAISVPKCLSG